MINVQSLELREFYNMIQIPLTEEAMKSLEESVDLEHKVNEYRELIQEIPESQNYNETLEFVVTGFEVTAELFPEAKTMGCDAVFLNVDGRNIIVCYDNNTRADIAHELKHFMDTVDGRLVTYIDQGTAKVKWDGEEHTLLSPVKGQASIKDYAAQPWEREAYEFMLPYCNEAERIYVTKILSI